MPHDVSLIFTLAGALTVALVFGLITQKLRLSPIVGYLLAGIVVGPYSPGFVADASTASQFAEIGIILLMFGVGLHFHLKELIAVQKIALPGALVQIAAATVMGMLATRLFGWSWESGAVFGISISVASTVLLTRVLSDNNTLHTPIGHVALGWLVVEDLFTILILVLLPSLVLVRESGDSSALWSALGWTVLKLVVLVAFTLFAGQKLIPLFLTYIARTGTRDLFTLAVLALALGIAVGSAHFFGASMALGAFLAGMVVGQSKFSARAAAEALPMRDAFAVLFFVSVGMQLNPASLLDNWQLSLLTLAIVLIGKPLAAFLVVILMKKPLRMALSVSVALAQIGEFSFILVGLATSLNVLPKEIAGPIIIAAVVSITLNPLLYKRIDPLLAKINKHRKHCYPQEPACVLEPEEDKERIVIVGYGPVGRSLERILEQNNMETVVIEMNIDTVKELSKAGKKAVHGDASMLPVLMQAGVGHASGLIISASHAPIREIVEEARSINPGIRTLVRAEYVNEEGALQSIKGAVVFTEEREIAISMAEYLMREFGATNEQIDNERRTIREDLQ